MPASKDKQLDELKKNVVAQEDKLGEALKIFNQLSENLSVDKERDSENLVLYETLNTAVTILGDLVASYRRYTDELERAIQTNNRRRETTVRNASKKSEKKIPEVPPKL